MSIIKNSIIRNARLSPVIAPPGMHWLDTFTGTETLTTHTADTGQTYQYGLTGETIIFGSLSNYIVDSNYVTNDVTNNPINGAVPIGVEISDSSKSYFIEGDFYLPSSVPVNTNRRASIGFQTSDFSYDLSMTAAPGNFNTRTTIEFTLTPGYAVDEFFSNAGVGLDTLVTARIEIRNNFTEVRCYVNSSLIGTITGLTELSGKTLVPYLIFGTNIANGTMARIYRAEVDEFTP